MTIATYEKTVTWLHHFGYLENTTPSATAHDDAVARLQRVYGLSEDGVAGPITRRAMGLFRCAVSDHSMPINQQVGGRLAFTVDETSCRWRKKDLTYAIGNKFGLGGSRAQSIAVIRAGFAVYAPITGMTFTEVGDWDTADIQIGRGRGKKWDFDGPGNVLAWAYLPCDEDDSQLLAMFDDTEPWNLKRTGAGIILQAVWLHELGHLLGLYHSEDENDLMAPYYNPQLILPQDGDIKRLQKLYEVEEIVPPVITPPVVGVSGLEYGTYNVTGTMQLQEAGVTINIKKDN